MLSVQTSVPSTVVKYAVFPEVSVVSADVTTPENLSVSELIRKYSKEYDVDEKLALNVACAESCTRDLVTREIYMNPNAKNPTSSASGIFQFIRGTWNSLCDGDVFDSNDNVRCGVKVLSTKNGIIHWEASRVEGFGNGWSNNPYFNSKVTN